MATLWFVVNFVRHREKQGHKAARQRSLRLPFWLLCSGIRQLDSVNPSDSKDYSRWEHMGCNSVCLAATRIRIARLWVADGFALELSLLSDDLFDLPTY